MKLHYLFLALSACCLTISCGNSSKNQQTEVTTQQVNPLEEAFKEIKILKDSCDKSILNKNWSVLDDQVRDFVQTEIIKNKIIQDKSNRYFDRDELIAGRGYDSKKSLLTDEKPRNIKEGTQLIKYSFVPSFSIEILF